MSRCPTFPLSVPPAASVAGPSRVRLNLSNLTIGTTVIVGSRVHEFDLIEELRDFHDLSDVVDAVPQPRPVPGVPAG